MPGAEEDTQKVNASVALSEIETPGVQADETGDFYRRRADIRNNMRQLLFETTSFLSSYVPPVTGEKIRSEDVERVMFEVRDQLEKGVFTDKRTPVLNAMEKKHEMNIEELDAEEYAKYTGVKMLRRWREKNLDGAMDIYYRTRFRNNNNPLRRIAVDREAEFLTVDQFVRFVKAGEYAAAVESLMRMAELKVVRRGDFKYLGLERAEEDMLAAEIMKVMVHYLTVNPRIFDVLRGLFAELKLPGLKDLDRSDELRGAALEILKIAAARANCYFEEALEVLEDLKLADREEILKSKEIRAILEARLADTAKKSPLAYAEVRDKMVDFGFFTAEEADNMEGVQRAIMDFLVEMYEVHPELSMLFNGKLRENKVRVQPRPEIIDRYEHYVNYNVVLSAFGVDIFKQDARIRQAAERAMQNKAGAIEEYNKNEILTFRGHRHLYGLELQMFLTKYPYFKSCFPDFRGAEFIGDGD